MTLALNLVIIEMNFKFRWDQFKFQPPDNFEWAPLWSNINEVYYPQDIKGK